MTGRTDDAGLERLSEGDERRYRLKVNFLALFSVAA